MVLSQARRSLSLRVGVGRIVGLRGLWSTLEGVLLASGVTIAARGFAQAVIIATINTAQSKNPGVAFEASPGCIEMGSDVFIELFFG